MKLNGTARDAADPEPNSALNLQTAPQVPGSRMSGFLPQSDGKRKTETEDSDFSRAEPRRPVAIGER
jgi:hypothetical protein